MTIATSEGGEGEEDSTDDGASGTGRLRLSRSTFRQLPAGCPAVYAAHVLAAGAHAVPIVDLDGAIVRVVTQADVVRFLAANMDAVPAAHGLSLGDLGLDTSGRARLVVAKFDERVMDVFQRMRHSNSGAVPVVDSTGCMTANLSMTDAKAVAKQASIRLLELPVSAFLTEISTATDIKSPSIYCRPTDTLSSCITTLAATRIHQVYFVDEAARPTAVLRVSDVLRTLLGEEA
jgi:CBS-domain-containing membrane protein